MGTPKRTIVLSVLAGLLLLAALGLGAGSAYGFYIDHHLDTEGVAVDARVTGVTAFAGDAQVVYETPSGPVETEVADWDGTPQVGDVLRVEYDPDDTSYARAEGSNEDFYLGVGFLAAALVCLGLAVGALVWAIAAKRRRTRQLASAGPWGPYGGPPGQQPGYAGMLYAHPQPYAQQAPYGQQGQHPQQAPYAQQPPQGTPVDLGKPSRTPDDNPFAAPPEPPR